MDDGGVEGLETGESGAGSPRILGGSGDEIFSVQPAASAPQMPNDPLVLYRERYTTAHCIICQRRHICQNLLLFPRREAVAARSML